MPGVTLELLGTGDAFASGGRFQACQLVRHGETRVLVDCGASSPVALARRGVDPSSLTHVVLTHLHGDHFGGVPFLWLDAAYNRPRAAPLVVVGPAGVEQSVRTLVDVLYPGSGQRVAERASLRFVELVHGERVDLGHLAVTPYAVVHGSGGPAHALRIEIGGRVLAFSGDTEWTPVLPVVARDADVFVCECVGWTAGVPSHLTHAVLADHAEEFTCRRWILTHMGPDMLARADDARWTCGYDGLVLEL